ncbi:MAG: YlxR family protein [bacterium]|nr:YlxR family protein [bacterium]
MIRQRKCVGCGEMHQQNTMIKLTKDYKTGEILVNPNSLTFGRSAYLCYNQNCISNALKKNKLNNALKTCKDLKGILDEQFKS